MDTRNPERVRRALVIVGFMLAVLVLVTSSFFIADYFFTKSKGGDQPSGETVTSSAAPSEKRPAPISDRYTVAASEPRVIAVPSLGIEAYVQRVGINDKGEMATPNNIYFTGWYVNGPAPGKEGVSIINGHAGGRYADGIFRKLTDLSVGDVIRVQMGDLAWREFTVVSATVYTIDDARQALFADDPSIGQELHLITCDGVFDATSRTYDRRLIVVAGLST